MNATGPQLRQSASTLAPMRVRGVAGWATGMPSWDSLCEVARGEAGPQEGAPKRPTTDLLAANERRRAPDTVLLALEIAKAACVSANADPATLPSVFTSMHGDLTITDYMCQTLATAPHEVSPTKFHNSVHNAAAGYWTIGVGCHAAATAVSAFRASFAQGLLEAAMQLADGAPQVLLVASDGPSSGPLSAVSSSVGLFGIALVLAREDAFPNDAHLSLTATLLSESAPPPMANGLTAHLSDNAMAPALVLLHALAHKQPSCVLDAGTDLSLRLDFS